MVVQNGLAHTKKKTVKNGIAHMLATWGEHGMRTGLMTCWCSNAPTGPGRAGHVRRQGVDDTCVIGCDMLADRGKNRNE